MLSGTLNFLFSTFGPECGFVDAVRGAMDAGYTEPDPRIDLSGVDVQRKMLMLAREAGYTMEMSDVDNPGFLPPALMEGTVQGFLEGLPTAEEGMQARLAEAASKGLQLRYATFERNAQAKQPKWVAGFAARAPFASPGVRQCGDAQDRPVR